MRGAVAGARRIELQRFVTALRVVEDSIVAAWRALVLERVASFNEIEQLARSRRGRD